jgi:AAA15 family ATPase/GTPase
MLLYFKTSNNLSFNEEVSFSTIAGNYKVKNEATGEKEDELSQNLIPLEKYKVNALRTSAIYGANASGKSNFLKALINATYFIRSNFFESNNEKFLLNQFHNSRNKNFELNFVHPIKVTFGLWIDGVQFEYQFSFSNDRIVEEILYEYRTQKPIEHFYRKWLYHDKSEWRFSKYFIGEKDKVKNITNQYSLYLTVGAVSKLPVCEKVFNWFVSAIIPEIDVDSPGKTDDYEILKLMYEDSTVKKFVLQQLKVADFSIKDFEIDLDAEERLYVQTIHTAYNDVGKETTTKFNYFKEESKGTRTFIAWLGHWLDIIKNNKVILIDEFGTSMHSLLSKHLLKAFNAKFGDKNASTAQLIFTTHDTNLMTRELFRPDQIWIAEKDDLGNSKLFPLSDFKLLKGKDLQTTYMQGLYGGIPHLKTTVDEY